ncbi:MULTISPECIES: DUF488 domain-containing protein [unclassified Pseudomonas]|jgi:Uncharacterized conserved protein|uniref:DUF488 domain-containing protein n=1 Tax=unclassified Pseudomonas TaxID=196821 RepID=UPI0008123A43|nr:MULTISPECIES: DUF488 domain-containing protein [unclassified Pseudomonas]SAM34185.1 hypothetical protein BN1864_LIB5394:04232 [Pseudomonas sp. 1 R 17]
MNLYTAGYEGLSIDAFIARLRQAGIDKVLDVREYPLSRKKGFSKNAFAQCLAAEGIAYEHIRSLGCPKPIRKQYKEDGNWATYAREFRAYIRTQGTVLSELLCSAVELRICMVCYEADASFCHRSLIAEAAQEVEPSLDVQHLPVKTTLFVDRLRSVA